MKPALRKFSRETSGAEIAEAALVLPLVFMMMLGIFWFGQAFRIHGTLTQAARQGVRAGVAPICTTCAGANNPSGNAFNAVQGALGAAKLDWNNLSQLPTTPTLLKCSDGTPQTCNPTPTKVCVQENVRLSTVGLGGAGVCGMSVSFQYPYQFWLPFTSINMQRIQLPAQAEMREEDR
jgi:Flp pilus assembly protein TadG